MSVPIRINIFLLQDGTTVQLLSTDISVVIFDQNTPGFYAE